ncbi:MAG: rRNA maturation RNase YbeY [Desulfonatronovibrio sp. MSAO_Bac4]|nr:MAG: rRNA maturation RNase YbeY [Desulfonatronovibrio sp. MSAO_Bac4]
MINIEPDKYLTAWTGLSKRELKDIVRSIASELGNNDPDIDILISDDVSMRDYNQRFLGMEGPTNVLSFPEDNPDMPQCLGQLIINADAVRRESVLYGQDPVSYMVRLMVHGILHLAGFDHGPAMDEFSDKIMLTFNV